jgi:hypothetical protein
MRILSWRWALAFAQITFAIAAFAYAPYQYKAGPHPVGDDFMLLGYRQTWPPPILRMSYAMNFPALTASYSLQFARWATIEVVRYNRPPFLFLTLQDCMFLLSVGVLWYWLGAKLDGLVGRRITAQRSRQIIIIGPTVGCVFAVGVAALATFYATLTDADRPLRQIGLFGLAWAAALLWVFIRKLMAVLRTLRSVSIAQ